MARPSLSLSFEFKDFFFGKKNVHITQGQDKISGYEDKATKSGRSFIRSFCSQCGANVLIGNPGGDIIGVPVGVVDDSCDWGELYRCLSAQRPILTWHAYSSAKRVIHACPQAVGKGDYDEG